MQIGFYVVTRRCPFLYDYGGFLAMVIWFQDTHTLTLSFSDNGFQLCYKQEVGCVNPGLDGMSQFISAETEYGDCYAKRGLHLEMEENKEILRFLNKKRIKWKGFLQEGFNIGSMFYHNGLFHKGTPRNQQICVLLGQ